MNKTKVLENVQEVIEHMPSDWLNLTTHRLDVYDERLAKTQFIDQFQVLAAQDNITTETLAALPTAYDYIRLGHPLSSVLEWAVAQQHGLSPERVIAFSSQTAPILAVLRKNLFEDKKTRIVYQESLPEHFNPEIVKRIYGYDFELMKVDEEMNNQAFDGSTIHIKTQADFSNLAKPKADFTITLMAQLGSLIVINRDQNAEYIGEIQHVRRRETIAMTPANCLIALKSMVNLHKNQKASNAEENKAQVLKSISSITGTDTKALVGSSGLSVQYAIMMGLIHSARESYPGKAIKFVVPPNCYGGTNDQARRVAACLDDVEVVDLPVDGDNDMVQSVNRVLDSIAKRDAVPYIIAEIPTNPRVEVPNLVDLKNALSATRHTPDSKEAIDPVFILDQTFCPDFLFLGEGEILSSVRAISYVSGSKFPSGGKCTAGYCVANKKAEALLDNIELHRNLCDNEATDLQYAILAQQMPSMVQRIRDAYQNTRAFVNFIQDTLPGAKINFVSEELAEQGFTPSVFSLDLPTKGNTEAEREEYKRALNLKLIDLMISNIPDESKYCVSYGQLKGVYWTIPATSTQGTTKEDDKDYIARVSLAPNMDLERHKAVFTEFVSGIG